MKNSPSSRLDMAWTKDQLSQAYAILMAAQCHGTLTEDADDDLDTAIVLLAQALHNLKLNLDLTKKGTTT